MALVRWLAVTEEVWLYSRVGWARYRGGDRRGKKREVDYKQHRATVVLLRGVGWERRLGVWINDVIVFVQLEPSAAR